MKKQTLLFALQSMFLAELFFSFSSCQKKTGGVDNNVVLETPYSMYFSDTAGAIYCTNDGINTSVIVLPDGVPCRALCTSGTNIIYIQQNHAYYSINNGVNFNHSYDTVSTYPFFAVNNLPMDLNQTMIINCAEWSHIYLTSQSPSSENTFGIVWSVLNGIGTSWYPEDYYDTVEITNPHNINCTSFTEMSGNGILVAYDAIHNRVFYRVPPFTTANRWTESLRTSATDTLPDNPYLPAAGSGFFFIGHLNNQLIAVDAKGQYGAYYSNDTGKTWFAISGLPANRPILSISTPFEQTCLVGTDSAGVYIYNANAGTFSPSNNGLPKTAVVWGITFKQNIYKNSTNSQLIYLATNTGIYQSKDMGQDWILTIPGNFTTIY